MLPQDPNNRFTNCKINTPLQRVTMVYFSSRIESIIWGKLLSCQPAIATQKTVFKFHHFPAVGLLTVKSPLISDHKIPYIST